MAPSLVMGGASELGSGRGAGVSIKAKEAIVRCPSDSRLSEQRAGTCCVLTRVSPDAGRYPELWSPFRRSLLESVVLSA